MSIQELPPVDKQNAGERVSQGNAGVEQLAGSPQVSSPVSPAPTPTPETDAEMLLEREGITHPELHETYMAWTDYWALGQHARRLERELGEANAAAKRWYIAANPYSTPEALREALSRLAECERASLKDAERLDWLERQHVEVRTPLRYGSRANFHATPPDEEGIDDSRSDLKEQIDAALAAEKGNT